MSFTVSLITFQTKAMCNTSNRKPKFNFVFNYFKLNISLLMSYVQTKIPALKTPSSAKGKYNYC